MKSTAFLSLIFGAVMLSTSSVALAAPPLACQSGSSFGAWSLQCSVAGGRQSCTMQLRTDGASGLRIASRTITAADGDQMFEVQTLMTVGSDRFAFQRGQTPSVSTQHDRTPARSRSGALLGPNLIGIQSDASELTFWALDRQNPETLRVTVDKTSIAFSWPHADFFRASEAMGNCQDAYLKRTHR